MLVVISKSSVVVAKLDLSRAELAQFPDQIQPAILHSEFAQDLGVTCSAYKINLKDG